MNTQHGIPSPACSLPALPPTGIPQAAWVPMPNAGRTKAAVSTDLGTARPVLRGRARTQCCETHMPLRCVAL